MLSFRFSKTNLGSEEFCHNFQRYENPMNFFDWAFRKGKLTTEFADQLSHKASKTSPHRFSTLILQEIYYG